MTFPGRPARHDLAPDAAHRREQQRVAVLTTVSSSTWIGYLCDRCARPAEILYRDGTSHHLCSDCARSW